MTEMWLSYLWDDSFAQTTQTATNLTAGSYVVTITDANGCSPNLINVVVPTTPHPTSGFLLMFPVEDVIYLNMSFEEASKFIVSAGTSTKKS